VILTYFVAASQTVRDRFSFCWLYTDLPSRFEMQTADFLLMFFFCCPIEHRAGNLKVSLPIDLLSLVTIFLILELMRWYEGVLK